MRSVLIRIALAVGVLAFAGFAMAQSYVTCSNPKFSTVVMTDGGSTIILDAGPDGGSLTVAGGAAGLVPVPAVNLTQRRQIQVCNSTENPTSTSIIKCAIGAPDGGLQLGVASPGHPIKVGECWPPVSSIQFDVNAQIWCIGTMNNSVTAEIVECQ
jgi:hypothetical protein